MGADAIQESDESASAAAAAPIEPYAAAQHPRPGSRGSASAAAPVQPYAGSRISARCRYGIMGEWSDRVWRSAEQGRGDWQGRGEQSRLADSSPLEEFQPPSRAPQAQLTTTTTI